MMAEIIEEIHLPCRIESYEREVNRMANDVTLRARIATRVHNALKEGPVTLIDNTTVQEAIFQVAVEAALIAVEEFEKDKKEQKQA